MEQCKRCSRCGEVKVLDDFPLQPRGPQGRHSHCKACRLADERKRLLRNGGSPDRREYSRAYYHANKAARNAARVAIREARPEQYAAQKAVTAARKAGRLVPEPCLFCDDPKVQAHHHSYAPEDRLNVTWLCLKHHRLVHRQVDEPGR